MVMSPSHHPSTVAFLYACLCAYPEFWRVLIVSISKITAILVASAIFGLHGHDDTCLVDGDCNCDIDEGGIIRQYASAASSLSYIVAALWIAYRGRCITQHNNLMNSHPFYSKYSRLVAMVGITSILYHVSLQEWAAWVEFAYQSALSSFVFNYSLAHLLVLYAWAYEKQCTAKAIFVGFSCFLWFYIIMALSLGKESFPGLPLVYSLAAILIEMLHINLGRIYKFGSCKSELLVASIILMMVAFYFRTYWSGCVTHSLWHGLSACASVTFYEYASTEESTLSMYKVDNADDDTVNDDVSASSSSNSSMNDDSVEAPGSDATNDSVDEACDNV